MENGEQSAFANPGSDQGPGSSGLTKREYFAAMALPGVVSKASANDSPQIICQLSVMLADELLKQLKKIV